MTLSDKDDKQYAEAASLMKSNIAPLNTISTHDIAISLAETYSDLSSDLSAYHTLVIARAVARLLLLARNEK